MFGASAGGEDPVTGSLNAALPPWLFGGGLRLDPVVIAQGACVVREGRLHIRTILMIDAVMCERLRTPPDELMPQSKWRTPI